MSGEMLRKSLWNGEIPVCFRLCVDDLATIVEEPEDCCMMIPRNSYFPLHTSKLKEYLTPYVRPDLRDSEVWLECSDKRKIKWHLPIGVTFDLYYGLEGQGSPWVITVHYNKFPDKELLRCPSEENVKSHFMSVVKESDSLKHASVIMNAMQKSDHDMLWNGLKMRSFDEFWTINSRLVKYENEDIYKHLPIRIHSCNKCFIQKLVPVEKEGKLTIEDVLELHNLPKSTRVITQGIEIPCEASAVQISQSLSYPDGFLHLSIVDCN